MNSSRQNKNARVFVVSGTTGAIDKALTPKRFQIAVVDIDTAMTDDSRPKRVIHDRPLYCKQFNGMEFGYVLRADLRDY